ncbi:RagB/SusD family nutrient uptake outer membrane protein [Flavivirga abyssicola]|uniref:RagB/SusD family nutrient uptake outer membrane protein n=1 Tax=Flavivirga abyssicola TaxID=3063533 RepID=UPI0026DF6B27|nr:RagB/SusD family nutrient uptake outer membrane protein [Flavivirga sp. MEBiC07777]WVK12015.1 RagB/SusD family nutrient uptake outer membrane protein [Flavivirga sp. MEBiC07777]
MFLNKYINNTIVIPFKLNQYSFILLSILLFSSCSTFLDEAENGNGLLDPDDIFEGKFIAETALINTYVNLRDNSLVSGKTSGSSYILGLYTDELFSFTSPFFFNELLPTDQFNVFTPWRTSYEMIFQLNFLIEGVEASNNISENDKNQLIGEALFLRSFLHHLLVEIYGDIPYVTTSNRVVNESISKTPVNEVYERLIEDLNNSKSRLELVTLPASQIRKNGRTRVDKYVVEALLARVNLYNEDWFEAATNATVLIDAFTWETDLSKIFLKDASTAIFQLRPVANLNNNTHEGRTFFIPENIASLINSVTLTEGLIDAFEPNDLRSSSWIGFRNINNNPVYFAAKYKQFEPTPSTNSFSSGTLEFSVIFRLAEQYLIRAEARARLGDIAGAQNDLNLVRTRAGLPNTVANTTDDLINAIIQERRVELFAEQGHRFFDLKRTNTANSVLSPVKPNWSDTDLLFPIFEDELVKNPNLLPQNPGY